MNTLAILYSDTYKQCHPRMYPEGTTKLVSYWVPRRSMFIGDGPIFRDKMIFYGLQAFLIKYLQEEFNDNFFALDKNTVKYIYTDTMRRHLNLEDVDIDRILDLHDLGYLPLEIRAIPEGTLVPMGVPCIEITNTHDSFAWVVQWIECILQSELWKPCCHATMAHKYRQLANEFYEKTSIADPITAMSDFGIRGMSGIDEAVKASSAWLTSFNKTSTIPALAYIQEYYLCKDEAIGKGAVSTEHSVMSANYAIDGDEISFIKRALTELYPNSSFSLVSDTYDYWNLVKNILPQCKNEIMRHNGKLLIRPDSGDIVSISVSTVEFLWETFGGEINSKGYKVVDPHIGIIYGDGCTYSKIKEIYTLLAEKSFAADNILFGVGAFSFAAWQSPAETIIYTRDTYGIAMKTTYAVINGKPVFLYKDPKTDTSHLKKSHKGCIKVYEENGELKAQDQFDYMVSDDETLLKTVYCDGTLYNIQTFAGIRKRTENA